MLIAYFGLVLLVSQYNTIKTRFIRRIRSLVCCSYYMLTHAQPQPIIILLSLSLSIKQEVYIKQKSLKLVIGLTFSNV